MKQKRWYIKNSALATVVDTYSDFAENTSIHGLKYTVQKDSSCFEKFFWVFIVLLGVAGSVFMLGLFWERFTSNPTRTSITTTYAPTISIPFPAVTVCNTNRILMNKVKSFVKKLELFDLNEEYVQGIFYQILAYTGDNHYYNSTELNILQELLVKNDGPQMFRLMRTIGQSCRELLVKCLWEGVTVDCKEIFVETYTPDGVCCSFNYNPRYQLDFDSIDFSVANFRKKSIYTYYYGISMGLKVVLNPFVEDAQYSSLYSSGMKIIIHHPHNYPGIGNSEKIVSVGRENLMQIKGTRLICSKEVKQLTPDQRECIYNSEQELSYFSEYSESNCMTECRTKYILSYCGCQPYYYAFSDEPVCNITKIPCITRMRKVEQFLNCDCPMQCDDVTYNVLSTSSRLVNFKYRITSFLSDVKLTNTSMLMHIYFGSQTHTILQKDTITSAIYLLSSLGGVFSLFLGCSFISVAEILYYVFIRFFVNLKLKRKVGKAEPLKVKHNVKLVKRKTQPNYEHHRNIRNDYVFTVYGRNTFLN